MTWWNRRFVPWRLRCTCCQLILRQVSLPFSSARSPISAEIHSSCNMPCSSRQQAICSPPYVFIVARATSSQTYRRECRRRLPHEESLESRVRIDYYSSALSPFALFPIFPLLPISRTPKRRALTAPARSQTRVFCGPTPRHQGCAHPARAEPYRDRNCRRL